MSDLDFDIGVRVPREREGVPAMVVLRRLEPNDLELASKQVSQHGSYGPPLKRLSTRHHGLAQMIAKGRPQGEAAIVAGYTDSTVSLLMTNPAFVELVNFYKRDLALEGAELREGMLGLGTDAVAELRDRLETDPESFSNTQLADLVAKTADRTGNGPSSTNVNVNIHANLADRLAQARKRAAEASKMIDVTPAQAAE